MHPAHVVPMLALPLQQSLQAASIATELGMASEVVIAALFHNCGHLVADVKDGQRDDAATDGSVQAQRLGSTWLRQHGFSRAVCWLVAQHAETRRYLCHKSSEYYRDLSDMAKADLSLQGGPMTFEEAAAFEQYRWFHASMALRHCCETAALNEVRLSVGLRHYKSMVEEHLGEALAERIWWGDLGEPGTYHLKR